jgi:hypothetical protein
MGIGASIAAAGCTAILGMDAPGLACLDECADAATIVPDAAVATEPPPGKTGDDGSSLDVPTGTVFDSPTASDAGYENENEDGPSLPFGVSCGMALSCSGATPVCCRTVLDAGGAAFQCVASLDSCLGSGSYGVACDSDNLCPGSSQACCHYPSSTKCVPVDQGTQACPGNAVAEVCDPHVTNGCGAGLSCKFVGAGVASPYYACER